MMGLFEAYSLTVLALGATGALILVQLIVVDVASIRAKHTPGAPIAVDHENFLFRAGRALANTNESVAAFVLLALFGMLSTASPHALNLLAWVYVVARIGHMLCYYAGARILRSISFGIGLTALLGMLLVSVFS